MSKGHFFLLLCILFLWGCSHESERKALEEYVREVKARPSGGIEPLPQVKPHDTFTYSVEKLRSPFLPSKPKAVVSVALDENGIHPDLTRPKEALESFPMDSLRMVGTLSRAGTIWALIVDKDGTVHRVTQGNYVGSNHGKIQKINEDKIYLKEIIPNTTGGWQERDAEMALIVEKE